MVIGLPLNHGTHFKEDLSQLKSIRSFNLYRIPVLKGKMLVFNCYHSSCFYQLKLPLKDHELVPCRWVFPHTVHRCLFEWEQEEVLSLTPEKPEMAKSYIQKHLFSQMRVDYSCVQGSMNLLTLDSKQK